MDNRTVCGCLSAPLVKGRISMASQTPEVVYDLCGITHCGQEPLDSRISEGIQVQFKRNGTATVTLNAEAIQAFAEVLPEGKELNIIGSNTLKYTRSYFADLASKGMQKFEITVDRHTDPVDDVVWITCH